jgi:hypothetical protein
LHTNLIHLFVENFTLVSHKFRVDYEKKIYNKTKKVNFLTFFYRHEQTNPRIFVVVQSPNNLSVKSIGERNIHNLNTKRAVLLFWRFFGWIDRSLSVCVEGHTYTYTHLRLVIVPRPGSTRVTRSVRNFDVTTKFSVIYFSV